LKEAKEAKVFESKEDEVFADAFFVNEKVFRIMEVVDT
jgi:hypothetical protein